MSENKRFNLRAGYYHNYTGICKNSNDNFTTNEVVDLLNSLNDENEQLKMELESFEQVNFTNNCDGTNTVLYMKNDDGDSV